MIRIRVESKVGLLLGFGFRVVWRIGFGLGLG